MMPTPHDRVRILERLQQVLELPAYQKRPVSMLTDFYQVTMMYGYFRSGTADQRVVFDVFYRTNPSGNGYVIAAGLEQVVWYLETLRFSEQDIAYLRSVGPFSEDFLEALLRFRFHGQLYAVPEGTIVFPNEPLLRFEGTVFELQLVESAVLSFVNHQSLIATKARRIVDAASTDKRVKSPVVLEMGLRRAQNMDASVFGARAAFLGGCNGTSNVLAGESFGIPVVGTQGHSWIQNFPSEIDAFRAYAQTFPDQTVLLVDTYDVLHSGVPSAIEVGREMEARGERLRGIRIDSGDLAYLSKRARVMLDEAGLNYVNIVVSGDLDEWTIRELVIQDAKVNSWGVGTSLITSYDCPALGAVYKMVAHEQDGELVPKIKVSENVNKVTNPGKKQVVRLFVDNSASADLIMLDSEQLDEKRPLELFDPVHTYKRKVIRNFRVEPLLVPIYETGELVYELPTLDSIRQRVESGLGQFSSEVLRPLNPHVYHVDLSQALWDLKQKLLHEMRPEH